MQGRKRHTSRHFGNLFFTTPFRIDCILWFIPPFFHPFDQPNAWRISHRPVSASFGKTTHRCRRFRTGWTIPLVHLSVASHPFADLRTHPCTSLSLIQGSCFKTSRQSSRSMSQRSPVLLPKIQALYLELAAMRFTRWLVRRGSESQLRTVSINVYAYQGYEHT